MSSPVQVQVEDVIESLTARIGNDAHEIAGLRALAKQQSAEISRLERVVTSLQDDLTTTNGAAEPQPEQ